MVGCSHVSARQASTRVINAETGGFIAGFQENPDAI